MKNYCFLLLAFIVVTMFGSCQEDPDTSAIQQTVQNLRAALAAGDINTAYSIMPDADWAKEQLQKVFLSEIPQNENVKVAKQPDTNSYRVFLKSIQIEAVPGPDGIWLLTPEILHSQTIEFIPAEK